MKKIELKNNSLLKDIVTLLNLIIVGYAAILVFLTILSVISYIGLSDRLGIKLNVQFLSSVDFSNWWSILAFVINLLTASLTIYLIYLARNFIKNLIGGKIFDSSNTQLADKAWKVFLALTFLSVKVAASGNPIALPFSFNASMSFTPLLGALIIWLMMKILEKGIDIAEENEFTI